MSKFDFKILIVLSNLLPHLIFVSEFSQKQFKHISIVKFIFHEIHVQQSMNFIIFREAIYSYINSGINIHRIR